MTSPQYQPLPIDIEPRGRTFRAQSPVSRMRSFIAYCLCVVAIVGLIALAIALLATTRFPVTPVPVPPTPSPPTPAPTPPVPPTPAPPPLDDFLCSAVLDIPAGDQPQLIGCGMEAVNRELSGTCSLINICQPDIDSDVRGANNLFGQNEPVGSCFTTDCGSIGEECECSVPTCVREVFGISTTFECTNEERGVPNFLCPVLDDDIDVVVAGPVTNPCNLNVIEGICNSDSQCIFSSGNNLEEECDPEAPCTTAGVSCLCLFEDDFPQPFCQREYEIDGDTIPNFAEPCVPSAFERDADVVATNDLESANTCAAFADVALGEQPISRECDSEGSEVVINGQCSAVNGICVPTAGQEVLFPVGQTLQAIDLELVENPPNCFSEECITNQGGLCTCVFNTCTRETQVFNDLATFLCTEQESPVPQFFCPVITETDFENGDAPIEIPCNDLVFRGICDVDGGCVNRVVADGGDDNEITLDSIFPCTFADPCFSTVVGGQVVCTRGETEIPLNIICLPAPDDPLVVIPDEEEDVQTDIETVDEEPPEDDFVVLVRELQTIESRLDARADNAATRKRQATSALSWSVFKANPQQHAGALVDLRQSDFSSGTLRVRGPCKLVFQEDVVFNPNPDALNWQPTLEQRSNDEYPFNSGFALDFFAAITVESDDVLIDLNGHELRQSREHHLQQSFAQLISISNSPFVDGEGPAPFGSSFVSPSRVVVRNGRLGFNAHHGIHGNAGSHVYLHDLEFEDYQIAAIALNGVTSSAIVDCVLLGTNADVPILGTYSQARFLATHFLPRAAQTDGTAAIAAARLDALLAETLEDVRANNEIDGVRHAEARALFANEARMVDGNVFGMRLTNRGEGTAQLDAAFEPKNAAQRVLIRNVRVLNTVNSINEFVALLDANGAEIRGPAGDVLGFDRMLREERIDALLDAQFAFAAAFERAGRPDTWRVGPTLNVPTPLLDWYAKGAPIEEFGEVVSANGYRYARNTDAMFHVNKGTHGIALETLNGALFENVVVDTVVANGAAGQNAPMPGETSAPDPLTYTATTGGHPKQAPDVGYAGNRARGVVLTPSRDVDMTGITVRNVRSITGQAIDYEFFADASAQHILMSPEQAKGVVKKVKSGRRN